MKTDQNFIPGWNAIYSNLITKVTRSVISSNVYQSPFTQMLQKAETGNFVENIHINPGVVLLQDTVTNSDILADHTDDIATVNYQVNVDLAFPSTYVEYVVRTSFTLVENVTELIAALTANIRTTVEYNRNELVKQMLFNAYQYGMMSSVQIDDPLASKDNAGMFAVALNNLIDDFKTEMNPRYIMYNNQTGLTPDKFRKVISREVPYIIVFNQYVRYAEFTNAVNLGLIERFKSGNSNQDWASRLITLNLEDFPTKVPTTNRSEITGQNVRANDVNFYEMPTDKDGKPLYPGKPTGGSKICGFVVDPKAIKLFSQLQITTSWLNPATVKTTNREIFRGIMELGVFEKICAVTVKDSTPAAKSSK